MRLLGAALAAAVCVSGGLLSARHLAARLRSLEGWERALMHMRCALETETAALPALLAAGATQGPAALSALKTLLDTAPAQEPSVLLASLPRDPLLTEAEIAALRACLRGLFAPTPASQLQALAYAQDQWTRFCQDARERQTRSGRLYPQLGWLAGAAVFILLC